MTNAGRTWLDHASALVVTFPLAGEGLIGIAAWLSPEPENAIHDGASGLVRQFPSGGIAAARDFIGGAAFFWCLFVGLPWLTTFFRKATRQDVYRGFIDD